MQAASKQVPGSQLTIIKGGRLIDGKAPRPIENAVILIEGQRIKQVFEDIEDPRWDGGHSEFPMCVPSPRHEPMRKISKPDEKIV